MDATDKKIEKYIAKGLEISKRFLKESIEKEEIRAIQKLVDKKKQVLHEIILSFEDYQKIVRKERIAFEEDLKDILFSEEIPKYESLKKQVYTLYSNNKQIEMALVSGAMGFEKLD